MIKSKYLDNYDKDFVQTNFIACEREICKKLNWNFHQITPFHFFENLLNQGLFEVGANPQYSERERTSCRKAYESVNKNDPERYDAHHSRSRSYSKDNFMDSHYGRSAVFDSCLANRSKTSFSMKYNQACKRAGNNRGRNDRYGYEKRRSYSRWALDSTNLSASLWQSSNVDIRRTAEFMLNLSWLIFELQDYSSSSVAAACILSARHINHQNPVWNDDLTYKTGYSIWKISKIANILLKNYNILQIGKLSLPSSQVLYAQPAHFNGELISAAKSSEVGRNLPTEQALHFKKTSLQYTKPFKQLRKSYVDQNDIHKLKDPNKIDDPEVHSVRHSMEGQRDRHHFSNKDKKYYNKYNKSMVKEPMTQKNSLIQRAKSSLQRGISGFLQNTGEIISHVKNEMAQEDFSFGYAFRKYYEKKSPTSS